MILKALYMRQAERHQFITTREFLREFSDLTQKGVNTRYTIVRHGKPIGLFTPYSEDGTYPFPSGQKKRVTLADLEALRFHSGEKNLSNSIDEIAYGISR